MSKGTELVRCHICDQELEAVKDDPLKPGQLLPCETCLTVITDTLDAYPKDGVMDDEPEILLVDPLDEDFDDILETDL